MHKCSHMCAFADSPPTHTHGHMQTNQPQETVKYRHKEHTDAGLSMPWETQVQPLPSMSRPQDILSNTSTQVRDTSHGVHTQT